MKIPKIRCSWKYINYSEQCTRGRCSFWRCFKFHCLSPWDLKKHECNRRNIFTWAKSSRHREKRGSRDDRWMTKQGGESLVKNASKTRVPNLENIPVSFQCSFLPDRSVPNARKVIAFVRVTSSKNPERWCIERHTMTPELLSVGTHVETLKPKKVNISNFNLKMQQLLEE